MDKLPRCTSTRELLCNGEPNPESVIVVTCNAGYPQLIGSDLPPSFLLEIGQMHFRFMFPLVGLLAFIPPGYSQTNSQPLKQSAAADDASAGCDSIRAAAYNQGHSVPLYDASTGKTIWGNGRQP
jgi:hypothetical protein